MVGEIAVEVEPPDGDDKPHPEVIGTAETVLDEEISGVGLAAERAQHHARRKTRMRFELLGND